MSFSWRRSSVLVAVLHLALATILVAMPVPHLWKVPAQFDSGYVPSYYPLFITVLIVPFALSTLTILALVGWRRGIHRWLIAIDAVTTFAAWTFLFIYVFSSELPIVLLFLAPACLIVVSGAAWRSRARPIQAT
jgi:hypothetical protein